MTDPYRDLCAELIDALDSGIPAGRIRMSPLADRARTLLAQPVAEVPSDEGEVAELVEWLRESLDSALQSGNSKSIKNHCRLLDVLGRPTPQPVAVSERLPVPEDCDEQGRCWMFGNIEGDWRLISVTNSGIPKLKYCFSHWLPHYALPTPEVTND